MEAKDLVLLMLIPILLVSIVVYTDKNPVITGAVTAKQEESNIIGTYSIMPSFRAKIDYNLEKDYKDIKEKLDGIIKDCKNNPNIEQCLKEKSEKNEWNCQKPKDEAVNILYDFIDKFNECIKLEEDGVVCRFSLDEREINTLFKSYEIRLTSENQRTRVELLGVSSDLKEGVRALGTEYINLENLVYTVYDYKDTFNEKVNPVSIIIKFEGKKPIIDKNNVFGEDDGGNSIPLSEHFVFYKKDNVVKFIEQGEEVKYLAPDPGGKIGLPKLIDLPKTKGFKFCAKSPSNKQFYAYDKADNTVKLRDIIYKFAVAYPNPLVPAPVKFLKAEDKVKAEKSIVLNWTKAKSEDGNDILDFDHYNIYCSKSSFQDKNTKEIKLNIKPTMAVKSLSNINYDSWLVDINKCEKEDIQDEVDYYFAVTAVTTSNKESKAIIQASAKSTDDLAPGPQKIILMNSDNVKEEKESSACIKLPISTGDKISNIWVGFFRPERNEDEKTDIKPTESLTYYLHFSRQNQIASNLNDCEDLIDSKKCRRLTFASDNDILNSREIIQRTFNKFKEIEDSENNNVFKEGETYCFTVVAKDKNDNVIKTLPYKFENPKQWLELESKPVKKGFFNEQGEIIYS